jgi:glycosyltransferase involved in cell wall biosynthesis
VRSPDHRLVAAIDASALADGRRFAGIGRYAEELIAALRALAGRVDVHVAAPRGHPRSNRWSYRYARGQPPLARLVRRVAPDVVHCLASEAALCFRPARQIVTVHDVVPWTDPTPKSVDARAYLQLQRAMVRRAGAVIVPGEVVVDEVASVLGVPADRITAIEHGVAAAFSAAPAADDAAIRAEAGVESGRYAIWVGSLHGLDPRKGLDVLFDAFSSLAPASRPLLALVGKHGQGSQWARERAAGAGIELVLPGYVEDSRLAALYRGAVAAVVPSRYEGFGLPALEAMACGAPVVVTDAGNSPAVVGDAALVAPVGNARALGEALLRLLDDPALRARLAADGPVRAGAFSWGRAAERTVEVYERVLSSRASAQRSSER